MSLFSSQAAHLWAHQFGTSSDVDAAQRLLKKFKFVSATTFRRNLRGFILSRFPASQCVAFFIEREMPHVKVNWRYKRPDGRTPVLAGSKKKLKTVVRMYEEDPSSRGRGLPRRWTMTGRPRLPVESMNLSHPEIGSEGIVANIVSRICLSSRGNQVMHPHANAFKELRPKHLVVVTDLIGSGTRSYDMLDSLWRVATIRSRWSVGLTRLSVLCYAATDAGVQKVKSHPSRPEVHRLLPCPTLNNSFNGVELELMKELCRRYAPTSPALGFNDTGALIAFDHSCPNNVPTIFTASSHGGTRRWNALFPSRSTDAMRQTDSTELEENLVDALGALRLGTIAENVAFLRAGREQQAVIILLAAVYRGRRNSDELAAATCLPLFELIKAATRAQSQQLLTSAGRLTANGYSLITELNQMPISPAAAPAPFSSYYYPASLRVPS